MEIKCFLRAGRGHFMNQDVVYPAVVDAGRIDGDSLLEYVSANCKVPVYQSRMVLQAVAEQMRSFACAGHSVEVPELGVFSLDVKAKVEADEQGKRSLKRPKGVVKFVPTGLTRTCGEEPRFKLVSQEVVDNVAITDEEAISLARRLTEEEGWFLQQTFMEAADVSRASASRVLNRLADEGALDCKEVGRVKMYALSREYIENIV